MEFNTDEEFVAVRNYINSGELLSVVCLILSFAIHHFNYLITILTPLPDLANLARTRHDFIIKIPTFKFIAVND